jgi:hypothetical protein
MYIFNICTSIRRANCQQYLRQSIQLTGLGASSFSAHINKLKQLHEEFGRHVSERSLLPPSFDTFRTFDCINLSTRYFTSRRDDPHSENVPFTLDVDPRGILTSMETDIYFHGEDNQVQYFTAKTHSQTTEDREWAHLYSQPSNDDNILCRQHPFRDGSANHIPTWGYRRSTDDRNHGAYSREEIQGNLSAAIVGAGG